MIASMPTIILHAMLAREFAAEIRDWLTVDQIETANNKNAYDSPAICHTHDFCDASMAMAAAFDRLMGRGQYIEDEHGEAVAQADLDMWNAAWSIAKSRRFWGDKDEALFIEWQQGMLHVEDLGQQMDDEILQGVPGIVYDGGYIEMPADAAKSYRLLITRDDWASSDLEALERILFFEWVLPEGYLGDQHTA